MNFRFAKMVLACAAMLGIVTPASALVTMDPGNIAGTVSIVSDGATEIEQAKQTITNGTNLNAIVGDHAGTFAKFKKKYGKNLEDAKKALADGKKRLAEGTELYNKAQAKKAEAQAKYQELMDKYQGSSGGEEEDYEDGDYEEGDYGEEYTAQSDSDYNAHSVSTLGSVNAAAAAQAAQALPHDIAEMGDSSGYMYDESEVDTEVAAFANMPAPSVAATRFDASSLDKAVAVDGRRAVNNSALVSQAGAVPVAAAGTASAKPEMLKALDKTTLKKFDVVDSKALSPAESTGRKAFGVAPAADIKAEVAAAPKAFNDKALKTLDNKAGAAVSLTAEPQQVNKASALKAGDLKANALQNKVKSLEDGALAPAVEGKGFRVSPAKVLKDRLSSNTVYFSKHLGFASQSDDDTKGVNYNSKGTFISPLPERCGISVADLKDIDKIKACINKIVAENNAKNQFDALNSRKECERMIYTTMLALLTEATGSKHEASNYDETLDEQEESSAGSTDTRDDTAVLAMSNEQTQILLNRMSTLISSQIIWDSVQQICAAPSDVLESAKDETAGGK